MAQRAPASIRRLFGGVLPALRRAGGALVLLLGVIILASCGGGSKPIATEPSPAATQVVASKATVATGPTSPAPSATADPTSEAKALYQQLLVLYAPADAASQLVDDQVQAIADGSSGDVELLYSRAEDAARIWGDLAIELHALQPENADLINSVEVLSLSSGYRRDAFQSLMAWIDSRDQADIDAYKANIAQAEELLMAALAVIVQYEGVPEATPTIVG